MTERVGTVVIGGGVVGCAVAREFALAGARDLFLLEAMPRVGEVQSGRNSGVVHTGLYYAAGSLKAGLCVEGNALMYELCRSHGVPVAQVGKLVVACDESERDALEALHAQARANGVPGVRLLTRAEARGGVFEVTGRRAGREETFEAEALVNAAGLHCDTVARMIDPAIAAEVVPLRGEYGVRRTACRANAQRRSRRGRDRRPSRPRGASASARC